MTDDITPARTYYTAQEIADLMLRWGATATLTQNDEEVCCDLTRGSDSMQLVFGRPQEFYEEVICRTWIFIESAPHKACDKWNEVPYFGTYSVVYDMHDSPMTNELGFVVRGVRLIEFARATSEDDIIQQIIMFWFTTVLIQDLVVSGSIDLTKIDRSKVPGELTRWWLGDVADKLDESVADNLDQSEDDVGDA
jgi:hypothetical protein